MLDTRSQLHPFTLLSDHQKHGPTVMSHGTGTRLTDSNGAEYLDAFAGLWCVNVGYGREEIADAVANQIKRLNYFQSFLGMANEPSIQLADRLLKLMPKSLGKVFFGLTGSDSNDTLIKIVWLYNNLRGQPERKKFIARRNAYHGVTVAAASLSGLPNLHGGFDVPLPIGRFFHVTTPHHYRYAKEGMTEEEFSASLAGELEETILREGPEQIAAFIAEPVMGAGGVFIPPAGYFEKIVPVLRKYEILFIADEVICGFGRLGKWSGSEYYDLQPDLMTLAKGLTSAYVPLSASLVSDSVWKVLEGSLMPFGHGYTYSAHPVSAAAALANLDIFERENLIDRAAKTGVILQRRLREVLADHPIVGEIRGIGMVAAIEFVANKSTKLSFDPSIAVQVRVYKEMLKRKVLVRPIPNSIAVSPPLIFTEAEVETLVGALKDSIDSVHASLKSMATA